MIRTVFVWSCVAIFTLVLGALAILTFPFDRKGNAVHQYARLWGWLIILVSGVSVTVEGLKHVDARSPHIYMCNHMGSFDIFALLAYLPVQFRWLAKAELFKIPVLGVAMKTAGYISLDRSERKAAYRSMEVAARTIKDGTSVVIFPEGSRSLDGSLQAFMKGGFTLAIRAGVPIVPIMIEGTWHIMPRHSLMIRKGAIRIVIDRPIPTQGLALKDRETLMKRVEAVIRRHLPAEMRGCVDAA